MDIIEIKPIEGANVYCHRPVIKMKLGLGVYAEKTTQDIAGFVEKLMTHLPTLSEHYCSRGRAGGFVERMREGTYFGHVIEHVALELQHLAGFDVVYGKTIQADPDDTYYVVIEYESKEGGVQALRSAVEGVSLILEGLSPSFTEEIEKIRAVAAKYGLGPSTASIAKEALKKGIPVMRLGEGSILQLGYGKYQQKVQATITGLTKCVGVDIACDKVLVKQLLADSGIPVPWGGVARTANEALELAEKISAPVVVKPFDGNQGKGVALNLKHQPEILRALEYALTISPKAIVEKFIQGKHYRIMVVGDKVVAAAERIPAFVVGDGKSTIKELVEFINRDPMRGEEHEKPLTKIKIDAVVIAVLARIQMHPGSVPGQGEIVYLRENANLSTGGIAIDVTGKVHPETLRLVLRAVRLIGLDVAGVDLVAKEIDQPLTPENGAIIEINAAPGIRMHHYPAKGKPRNVAETIVEMLFPHGSKSRIPIISITGTNGKTTVTRLIGHILQESGRVTGMTTSDGIYINGSKIVSGDTTGPQSAKVVLRDPTVECAVLETARGGILRAGLGYDSSDAAIITNISSDHLGLGGIETLEDMAHVKSVVAEAVGRKGKTILNADECYVAQMADRARSEIIYFSVKPDDKLVRRHLSCGGTAVLVKSGNVIIAKGAKTQRVLPVKQIPCTRGGVIQHNIQNVAAAVAGCMALDVDIAKIRAGLLSFISDEYCNPGRFNSFSMGGFTVIIDYGHNEKGYQSTLGAVKKMKPNRIIGVLGMPGDRKNEDIQRTLEVAADFCDYFILKEDTCLRGRKTGEVAGLMKKVLLKKGIKKEQLEIILTEVAAVCKALEIAQADDVVVVFYEKYEPVYQVVSEYQNNVEPTAMENQGAEIVSKSIG